MFHLKDKMFGNNRKDRSALGLLLSISLMLWVCLTVAVAQESAVPSAPKLSCAEIEEFLHTAKIGPQRGIPVGVTAPKRATLDDGKLKHDAAIQTIDESKTTFTTQRGTELNFRDIWKFNVAGYELAKILELNMVPPYVERKVAGNGASLSWWVNDAMMESERYRRKIEPPDVESWNKQMYAVRVFHQLIYETDPNLTNILITKDWQIWMIDFTRAFRMMKDLQNPKELVKCDRKLLANLRGLTKDVLQQKLGRWLTKSEIEAILPRRDLIVKFFDNEVAKKGEAAVLYDLPRTSQPCGSGLQACLTEPRTSARGLSMWRVPPGRRSPTISIRSRSENEREHATWRVRLMTRAVRSPRSLQRSSPCYQLLKTLNFVHRFMENYAG